MLISFWLCCGLDLNKHIATNYWNGQKVRNSFVSDVVETYGLKWLKDLGPASFGISVTKVRFNLVSTLYHYGIFIYFILLHIINSLLVDNLNLSFWQKRTGKPFRPGALRVCMDSMLSTTFSTIESRQLNILNLIIALLKETFKSSSQEGLDEVNSSLKLAKKYSSISLDHLSTSYPSLSYQCCWTFFE